MADELTVQSGFNYQMNGRIRPMAAASTAVTVAGNGVIEHMQIVPVAGEAVNIGDVTSLGFASFRNATNGGGYIKVGTKDGAGAFIPFLKLNANSAEDTYDSPPAQCFIDELTVTGTNLLWAVPQASAGNWATGQAYAVGVIRTDSADASVWVCLVAHTSAEVLMATDRTAHPTYWLAYVPLLEVAINDR